MKLIVLLREDRRSVGDELRLVHLGLIVVDADAAAEDQSWRPVRVVGQAQARSEVLVIGVDDRRPDLAEAREQLFAGVEVEAVDVVQFLIDRFGRTRRTPSGVRSSGSVRG